MTKTEITSKVEWPDINWRKVEFNVWKLQKRIYRASISGNIKLVRKLQKTLTQSWYGKLLSVRRVTQENKGKRTAGVDGVKVLTPGMRINLVETLRIDGKANPTKRVWTNKPGKKEMRPLGIPTIEDRGKQTLMKLALEPQWEAVFEKNSYGFRPGRNCHDAIAAIFSSINKKPKYVLDTDIAKCFDKINHDKLLEKLNTFPKFRRQIKAWLKCGVIDFSQKSEKERYLETTEGTPQGNIISPLLANLALHGIEKRLEEEFPSDKQRRWIGAYKSLGHQIGAPRLIRYADDFAVLCEDLEIIKRCKTIIEEWLKEIGLELKASKTRIVHTLEKLGGEKAGFQFLGFEIRQFKVGRHHSGKKAGSYKKAEKNNLLGFKTIIKPSKDKIKTHYKVIKYWCDKMKAMAAGALIRKLNPIIRGWCNYQSPWNSKITFSRLNNLIWSRLWRWAERRHPDKNRKWIARKYFKSPSNERLWTFYSKTQEGNTLNLLYHSDFPAGVRWIKVKGNRSPYDGDEIYWSKRLGSKYLTSDPQKSRLIKVQNGKCAYCKTSFKPDDKIEKHHLIAKVNGGSSIDKNLVLLHLTCHDRIDSLKGVNYDKWVLEKTTEKGCCRQRQ
ncbi:MAG: group II intron reverse transcriptase/maturase [Candidatus Eremiobacterota bacterium]